MKTSNGFSTLEFQKTFCRAKGLELITETVEIGEDIYRIMLFRNYAGNTIITYNIGYSVIEPFPNSISELDKIFSILKKRYPELSYDIKTVPMINFDISGNSTNLKVIKRLSTQVLQLDKYRLYGDKVFKGSVRTDIRRAGENNLELEECSNIQDLEEFLKIFEDSKIHNNSNYNLDFNVLYELLNHNKLFKLILAKDSNREIVSGSAFIFSETNVFYWFNANVFEKRHYRANYMILSYIIDKYKNYEYINMGYSASKSIEKFKKAWGAEDYYYYFLSKDDEQ